VAHDKSLNHGQAKMALKASEKVAGFFESLANK
jgi:hypothetical protein